ncbi:complement C1q-like protein 2 [Channa argus]|uniref:complement C1q-like protein 2 n=1 Tax=Channa argus TaxID=215402 RepID=UPI0035217D86
MKISLVFLLLLLVRSVSTDQPQMDIDSEINAKQTFYQHPCLQDVHAVLRELTASLAKLKVEMMFLQRDSQAQAAKLKELEEQQIEVLRQKTEVEEQKIEVEKQRTEVNKLKQQLQVQKVAFSASLVAEGDITLGPFATHMPLIFRRVVTNVGQAYNPNSGVFTAPVRGVYQFEWHIGVHGDGSHATGAVLVKNAELIFIAYENQSSHYGTSSQGASLLLEAGDVVVLRLWQGTKIFDNQSHHTTFSGHLLFMCSGNTSCFSSTV